MPMIAITTSNSTSVNASRRLLPVPPVAMIPPFPFLTTAGARLSLRFHCMHEPRSPRSFGGLRESTSLEKTTDRFPVARRASQLPPLTATRPLFVGGRNRHRQGSSPRATPLTVGEKPSPDCLNFSWELICVQAAILAIIYWKNAFPRIETEPYVGLS